MNNLINCLPCNEKQEMVTGYKNHCHNEKVLSGITSDKTITNEVSTQTKQQKL